MRCIRGLALAVAVCMSACSVRPSLEAVHPKPEARLLGKWQTDAIGRTSKAEQYQMEFFADGTVVQNQNIAGKWSQSGAGTFKAIDQTHIKMELQPNWFFGATVYELTWRDQDHVSFRAADDTLQLMRLK